VKENGIISMLDMGFTGLKTFGPQLIHHTQLKIRANISVQDFMIVDTPGVIDMHFQMNIIIST
jgi:hypothetical protein